MQRAKAQSSARRYELPASGARLSCHLRQEVERDHFGPCEFWKSTSCCCPDGGELIRPGQTWKSIVEIMAIHEIRSWEFRMDVRIGSR